MGQPNERTCCLTGVQHAPSAMVRLALDPSDTLVPDLKGKLSGRGAWLSVAAGPKLLSGDLDLSSGLRRALKSNNITVPDDLGDRIIQQMMVRVRDYIGLARRVGQLVMGAEKVTAVMPKAIGGVLILAVDGGGDGFRKICQKLPTDIRLPVVECLDREALGAALGREEVVYGFVKKGPLSQSLLEEVLRLEGFRGKAMRVVGRDGNLLTADTEIE